MRKSEVRSPKSERNPKLETRNRKHETGPARTEPLAKRWLVKNGKASCRIPADPGTNRSAELRFGSFSQRRSVRSAPSWNSARIPKPARCCRPVAQAGSLLFRRLATCGNRALFPTRREGGPSAGCQPAIQQVANLRYGEPPGSTCMFRRSGSALRSDPARREPSKKLLHFLPAIFLPAIRLRTRISLPFPPPDETSFRRFPR